MCEIQHYLHSADIDDYYVCSIVLYSLVVLPDLCLGSMACFVFPSALSQHFGNQNSACANAWAKKIFYAFQCVMGRIIL